MKFLAVALFFTLHYLGTEGLVLVNKRGVILDGELGGNAELDTPIEFTFLGAPVSVTGGGSAKAYGSAHLGKKRALHLGGSAKGDAYLDPMEVAILGIPIRLSGGAEGSAHGNAVIGKRAAKILRGLVLNGYGKGSAKLDAPIETEIIGIPISLNGGGEGEIHGSAYVGRKH